MDVFPVLVIWSWLLYCIFCIMGREDIFGTFQTIERDEPNNVSFQVFCFETRNTANFLERSSFVFAYLIYNIKYHSHLVLSPSVLAVRIECSASESRAPRLKLKDACSSLLPSWKPG